MDGYTTMTSHAKTMEIIKGRGRKTRGNDGYGFETDKDNKGSNRGSGMVPLNWVEMSYSDTIGLRYDMMR